MVEWLQALERMDKVDGDEPDRRFTERLARQHDMLKSLRQSGERPNISQFARTSCTCGRYYSSRIHSQVEREELVLRSSP